MISERSFDGQSRLVEENSTKLEGWGCYTVATNVSSNRPKENARPVVAWSGVVEMGESRTPRPRKRKRRCTTGVVGVFVWHFRPPPTGFVSTCLLVLHDA